MHTDKHRGRWTSGWTDQQKGSEMKEGEERKIVSGKERKVENRSRKKKRKKKKNRSQGMESLTLSLHFINLRLAMLFIGNFSYVEFEFHFSAPGVGVCLQHHQDNKVELCV